MESELKVLDAATIMKLVGQTLVLHEFRKNKVLKKMVEVKRRVVILRVRGVYSSNNKIVECKSTEVQESNECMDIMIDPDGFSVKNPDDVLKFKYVFTNE